MQESAAAKVFCNQNFAIMLFKSGIGMRDYPSLADLVPSFIN